MLEEEIKKIKNIIKNHEKRIEILEERIEITKPEEYKPTELEGDIKKLANKLDTSEEKIKEIFDFEDNTLTLTKIVGKDEKEKTQKITLPVLWGYKHCFGKNEVLSKEIRRNVAINGIPINNFSTHLNQIMPSLILRKGKLKSSKTSYKLTFLGESKAIEILQQLLK